MLARSFFLLALFAFTMSAPILSQSCQPGTLGWSVAANATRVMIVGNSAQRPAGQIAGALNQAMNTWNNSSCQSASISYSWFQSQSSGAERRVNVYFNAGLSDIEGESGSTACAEYENGAVGEIRSYTHFDAGDGQVYPCPSEHLGLFLAHELGHYLGVGHTPSNTVCGDHLMTPVFSGDETLHAIECQVADDHNETGWEAGEVGCTDNDWCDPDHCSPILIDFGGDLFQLSGTEAPVTFDIDGRGRERKIGWTSAGSNDGFLCRDLNHNGRIDSGAELFGTATELADGTLAANGYEAMAELDQPRFGGNQDGRISSEDSAFWRLCVWHDRNHNAVSEPDELQPLSRSGVVSLGLAYEELPRLDEHNNVLLFHGGATVSRDGFELYVRTVDVFFTASERVLEANR